MKIKFKTDKIEGKEFGNLSRGDLFVLGPVENNPRVHMKISIPYIKQGYARNAVVLDSGWVRSIEDSTKVFPVHATLKVRQ